MELSAKNWPPQGHFERLKMTPVGAFVTVSTPARSHSLTHSLARRAKECLRWTITVPFGGLIEKSGVSSSFLPEKMNRHQITLFPCIKSVSWIHGKTSKTDRR